MALEVNSVGGRLSSTLSSEWDGLSPHLLAKFYEVYQKDAGGEWLADDGTIVVAPLTDSNLEATLNWQSPFENSGPEASMPALMAMLQSGAITPVLDAFDAAGKALQKATGIEGYADSLMSRVSASVRSGARGLEGRTGITRLNSTQVFSGMPPIKFQVTALFRAWSDPAAEVEAPFNQLMSWALPERLSELGPILSRAVDYAVGGPTSMTDVLAPSKAPTKIGLTYKGKRYAPLVIESIGQPINSPVDSSGRFVELLVPLTLCTLTALDRQDWKRVGSS